MANINLTYDGKTLEFPLTVGSEKEGGIDIAKLRSGSGLVTLDPGFMNTASTTSAITFLDGEKGILRYRGYPIEQLAEKSTFIEVAYLLLYGELPSASQLATFQANIAAQSLVPEDLKHLYRAFPRTSHPMAMLGSAVNALSAFHEDANDPNVPAQVELATHRILAQLPVLAAWGYKHAKNQPFVYPDASLGYTANFLKTLFGVPTEQYAVDDDIRAILDLLLILHADHEQNCSTSTVRIVGSSKANLFTSVNAGISALWGPRHGGANQEVLEMLEMIHNDGHNLQKYVDKAKDKNSGFLLMGFGHRVYKNFDPRAKIIKVACDKVLAKLGIDDPLLDLAHRLEETALKDDYFVSRKLYPNVDFYSGIIYRALKIPTNMFTVMFALGRLPGWTAHWREMNALKTPIGRPRQIYTGATERNYVGIDQR
ncbi:MAG: citrate synthase [Myxococcales bacterium]|jgi:citrate synthase|nr:citrate synthase [Myxococcales bacterium]